MKVTTNLEDIIESGLSGSTIFKQQKVLSPDHIPSRLPHREEKIKELSLAFRELTTNMGSASVRVVVSGPTGTGKTVTTKSFGEALKKRLNERGLRLEYIHANCHSQRTLYLLTMEIASHLKLPIPVRGLSSQEAFKIIHDYLVKRNIHLILTLDEFDYLINTSSYEDIYFLVRLYDELSSASRHISYIFIMRDEQNLYTLDRSIRDHILRNVIRLEPYKSHELKDILMDRVNEAFYPNVVPDETVEYISNLYGHDKGGSGNARLAIEALEVAGKIAEARNSPLVLIEHVKEANSRINVEAGEILDEIPLLDLHLLIMLKALINLHNRLKVDSVPIGKLEKEYAELCAELGEEPRRHTQIYEYVRRMKLMGILETQQSGKGMRGRTTLISLSVPITQDFEDLITKNLRMKLDNREEPV
ncbi:MULTISPECIES: ORC1-type DNA replication protein [Metallosphaera]|uniref:ORC1-type DNA replication protein n=1 Tax=Metallosphaera TaxID=41980 RepID=UPI001F0526FB|nr:ORC1-type DNA replication protein [Metallosphaera sedula]MCH1770680.1 ORC1-type DNA replication protein [Metallosphaera sedula]MCP6728878.1 ORC1-type DNA replication protein [Metallosphaera sedula]